MIANELVPPEKYLHQGIMFIILTTILAVWVGLKAQKIKSASKLMKVSARYIEDRKEVFLIPPILFFVCLISFLLLIVTCAHLYSCGEIIIGKESLPFGNFHPSAGIYFWLIQGINFKYIIYVIFKISL